MMLSTPARKRAALALLYACGAAFILLVVGVLASVQQQTTETRHLAQSVRTTQLEGTPLGRQLASSAARILDCTEPEGQCFKDSQERTEDAVGSINRVIVLAAACSVGVDPDWSVQRRQMEIQSCVIQRLSRKP